MVKEGIIKTPGSIVEQSKIVASPFPNGVPRYYTKMSTEIFNIINQLGQGKLTPEAAADLMEQKVNELVKANKQNLKENILKGNYKINVKTIFLNYLEIYNEQNSNK